VELTEEGWDDLDQGWWGRAIVDGPDVYLAETDLEALTDLRGDRIECREPGSRWLMASKSGGLRKQGLLSR
jgi:hypothetical protein